jgi:putative pyruvate formate lyase activating enzyme
VGREARVFSAQTEVTDELELLPTYAVAFSGCQLRCDFCVTGAASWNARVGEVWEAGKMEARVQAAVSGGARSVMVLGGEPVLHLTAVLELAAMVPEEVPLVLKTNGGLGREARGFLGGVIDVWLPDFKFGNDRCALRLAGVDDYWAIMTKNVEWMAREGGGALVVRHLLMPGHLECCWEPVARWLSSRMAGVRVSLREGYVPAWKADRHPELRRWVSGSEMERARQVAAACGLELVP